MCHNSSENQDGTSHCRRGEQPLRRGAALLHAREAGGMAPQEQALDAAAHAKADQPSTGPQNSTP